MKRINFERKTEITQKHPHHAIKIILAGLVVMLVLEVWMVNRLSTYGNQLAQIKQQEVGFALKNQLLENQIARAGALSDIEHKSEVLGFSQIASYTYLKVPVIASAR